MDDLPVENAASQRSLSMLEAENHSLRRERDELEEQLAASRQQQNPWNSVALVGAIVGLLGVIGTALIGYFGTGDGNIANRQSVVCEQAYMIVADEALNPSLNETQSKALIRDQLQILTKCGKFLP